MTDWDGDERRAGSKIPEDIAVIKRELEFIHAFMKQQVGRYNKFEDYMKDINDKVVRMNGFKDDFKAHVAADRWMFGIFSTLLIGVLVKLFVG